MRRGTTRKEAFVLYRRTVRRHRDIFVTRADSYRKLYQTPQRENRRRRLALLQFLLPQFAAEGVQFIGFDLTGCSGHDMANQGANTVSLIGL